jgi:hypothetical protein
MSSCPLDYRYSPTALNRPADRVAQTAYVIGGLYGNREALRAIQAMARAEKEGGGAPMLLVFNGDFHWFDAAPDDFLAVQQGVLAHWPLAGNVEAELARPGQETDCGCAYPAYVDPGVVERSNRIFARLKRTALGLLGATQALARLPRHGVLQVGGRRIGILHGDAHTLSGWRWAAEALPGGGNGARAANGLVRTAPEEIAADFRAARVLAFATTHTCLPFLFQTGVDDEPRAIINNGSAGMPNFRGTDYGLLTRVSARPEPPPDSLYGANLGGIRLDALPVRYDAAAWRRRFLATWPPGSAGYVSYYPRIMNGPAWSVQDAVRRYDAEEVALPDEGARRCAPAPSGG